VTSCPGSTSQLCLHNTGRPHFVGVPTHVKVRCACQNAVNKCCAGPAQTSKSQGSLPHRQQQQELHQENAAHCTALAFPPMKRLIANHPPIHFRPLPHSPCPCALPCARGSGAWWTAAGTGRGTALCSHPHAGVVAEQAGTGAAAGHPGARGDERSADRMHCVMSPWWRGVMLKWHGDVFIVPPIAATLAEQLSLH
jgi:hypothetical protein